jgi:hypothetical protein
MGVKMFFPTDDEWHKYEITNAAHKFFVLRWQELFDEETFDSWQVRTSNLNTILSEINSTVDVVKRVHSHHVNIEYLLNEAAEIIKKDITLKTLFPFAADYLDKLKESYNSHVKNQNNINLAEFQRLINVMIGNLSTYQDKLFRQTHTILAKPPDTFKKDLYTLALNLGVELISQGYSVLALRDSLEIILKPGLTFIKRFEKLHHEFNCKEKEFECYFMVKWPKELLDIDGFEVKLTAGRPAGEISKEEQEFYAQNKEGIIAIIKVHAKDVYSAKHLGEKILEDLFAVSKLYQKNKETSLYDYTIVIAKGKSPALVGADLSRLTYIKDTKVPRERITEFAGVRHSLPRLDRDQLNASLQFHKLAMLAPTDESRLVNLWIALESLIQDGGTNIIDRICKYVPKSCATGYIHRKVLGFTIDVKELWRHSKTDTLLPKLEESTKGRIHFRDVLRILLDKQEGELIGGFAAVAAQNELLIYRLSKLVDEFKTPGDLAKSLERNVSGVTWQLRRIYRTRNHITHQGISPKGTRQLIQHLNSYYIITYYNLIYDLGNNKDWSIADALQHRLSMYDYFISRLKEYSQNPICFDALINASILLNDSGKEGAWKWLNEPLEDKKKG